MIRPMAFILVSTTSMSVFAAAPDFYTINDQATSVAALHHEILDTDLADELNPLAAFQEIAQELRQDFQNMISLVNWNHHKMTLEDPLEPFNRNRHFGGWWIDDYDRGGCIDTRAKVLARQSALPVTYNETGCRVVSGKWKDPYTNQIVTAAGELDIDHVVPLKNSYMSGGWKWTREKRCLYANFLSNSFHLLPVNTFDNRSKGEHGPDGYMPPNTGFACQYLAEWLKIKLIWDLALPPNEASAITQLLKQNRCSLAKLSIPAEDLRNQRRIIATQREICVSAL